MSYYNPSRHPSAISRAIHRKHHHVILVGQASPPSGLAMGNPSIWAGVGAFIGWFVGYKGAAMLGYPFVGYTVPAVGAYLGCKFGGSCAPTAACPIIYGGNAPQPQPQPPVQSGPAPAPPVQTVTQGPPPGPINQSTYNPIQPISPLSHLQ